jgi:hypothetical protein
MRQTVQPVVSWQWQDGMTGVLCSLLPVVRLDLHAEGQQCFVHPLVVEKW